MSQFGQNFSFGNFLLLKGLGNLTKSIINRLTTNQNKIAEAETNKITSPNQTNPTQSLANTNSNINLNQTTQTSPNITQGALNTQGQKINQILKTDFKNYSNYENVLSTPDQGIFQGSKDLPSYAGIANMSLKSWIANRDSKTPSKFEFKDKELSVTLEGIKGFQRKHYDGFGDESKKEPGSCKRKFLLVLSKIFSSLYEEQASIQETEVINKITSFKKLGSLSNENKNLNDENIQALKNVPPSPVDLNRFKTIDCLHFKWLYQLLALPKEFPECIRLFAGENVEIITKYLSGFLKQRFSILQEQLLGGDPRLNKIVAEFVPFLNQNDFSYVLPLVLLYYPLPLPKIFIEYEFEKKWKKSKSKTSKKEKNIIASCEVYFLSATRGRFLLKFSLTSDGNVDFDIQLGEENEHIIKAFEMALEEAMILLENPPNLSDLNILLTKEIYEATDIQEELAITSSGPLRIEILLAVYSCLVILNQLNDDPDPAGVIEMK